MALVIEKAKKSVTASSKALLAPLLWRGERRAHGCVLTRLLLAHGGVSVYRRGAFGHRGSALSQTRPAHARNIFIIR